MFGWYWAGIGMVLGRYWDGIGPVLGRYCASIRLVLGRYWTGIGPVLDRYWTGVGPVLDRYWTGVGPVLGQYWTGIGPVFGTILLSLGTVDLYQRALVATVYGTFILNTLPSFTRRSSLKYQLLDKLSFFRFGSSFPICNFHTEHDHYLNISNISTAGRRSTLFNKRSNSVFRRSNSVVSSTIASSETSSTDTTRTSDIRLPSSQSSSRLASLDNDLLRSQSGTLSEPRPRSSQADSRQVDSSQADSRPVSDISFGPYIDTAVDVDDIYNNSDTLSDASDRSSLCSVSTNKSNFKRSMISLSGLSFRGLIKPKSKKDLT